MSMNRVIDARLVASFDVNAYSSGVIQLKSVLTNQIGGHDIWLGCSIVTSQGNYDYPPIRVGNFSTWYLTLGNDTRYVTFPLPPEDLQRYSGTVVFALWENKPVLDTPCRRLAEISIGTDVMLSQMSESLIWGASQVVTETVTGVTSGVVGVAEGLGDIGKYIPIALIGIGGIILISKYGGKK